MSALCLALPAPLLPRGRSGTAGRPQSCRERPLAASVVWEVPFPEGELRRGKKNMKERKER